MHAARNKNILISGPPGIGKTTVIRKISQELKSLGPAGFYTAEIREGEIRKGFELISLGGEKGVLAHVDIPSPLRVGKYKVDIAGFEDFLDSLALGDKDVTLVIIDEIGKMECLSRRFIMLMGVLLASPKRVIATVALKGGGFIEEVKKREDVRIFAVTEGNRDALVGEIAHDIKTALM